MLNLFKRLQLKLLRRKAEQMFTTRQSNAVSDMDLHKEITIYYKIADIYDKLRFNKNFPYASQQALEAYRMAAGLNDINAQFIVGKRLLEQGQFWQDIKKTIFACKAHDKYMQSTYDEAFVYLESAMAKGHMASKRLLGFAYIRGLGVAQDREKGLRMIVESIEQENAWDNAEKIVVSLGLNKAEFFSSITSLRNKTQMPPQ